MEISVLLRGFFNGWRGMCAKTSSASIKIKFGINKKDSVFFLRSFFLPPKALSDN